MTDLERRLEAALKALNSPERRKLNRLTEKRLVAEQRLLTAKAAVSQREHELFIVRELEDAAKKKAVEAETEQKRAEQIEYNQKVRNR